MEDIHYKNGSCIECGCYWQVDSDVVKAIDCKCRCHDGKTE